MTGDLTFDWLDGTVTLPLNQPSGISDTGLTEFFENPNAPSWEGDLGRILFHESIHFWQFLSSAYLANMVQAEWLRMQAFESTGEVRQRDDFIVNSTQQHPGQPFSAMELMECWARYWDVHTRDPRRLLEEDGLNSAARLAVTSGAALTSPYSSVDFDTFMQTGRDCAVYARPYCWALEYVDGDSSFLNLVFPVLTFFAFGSPKPVEFFVAALKLARSSDALRIAVRDRTKLINVDWLNTYETVIDEAIDPAIRALGLPLFTAGWDVLSRGKLGAHPIYGTYPARVRTVLRTTAMFNLSEPEEDSVDDLIRCVSTRAAATDPLVVFMFPGQPVYRSHLGNVVPPPRVRFRDSTWNGERVFAQRAMSKLGHLAGHQPDPGGATLAHEYESFDGRVRAFRRAEYSARRGIAPGSFD